MPATVVPASPGVAIRKYAVIGMYHDQPGSQFVKHLALARTDGVVESGKPIPVWHMKPPLVAGGNSGENADPGCPAHVVGWISLTADERDAIDDWRVDVDKEDRSAHVTGRELFGQYTAALNEQDRWHRDEQGRPLFRRFSCVSFVTLAYSEGAGVQLLQTPDLHPLPACGVEVVSQVYEPRLMQLDRVRTLIGLPGDGPWPIELPGYVCHALNRAEDVIRSTPFATLGLEAGQFP